MNYPRVATRYSKALLDLAKEQNVLDAVRADAAYLKDSILASGDLAMLLKNLGSTRQVSIAQTPGKLEDASDGSKSSFLPQTVESQACK